MTADTSKALFLDQIDDLCVRMGDIPRHEAFPRWICQNVLGIADNITIDDAVSIGGRNDYGVDIFHSDEHGDSTEQLVC